MKVNVLRTAVAAVILIAISIGLALHQGIGTLSAFGWEDVALLCPLGALGTMIASHTLIPRAAISLVVAVVAIVIFGRAFCAWVCPVPLVGRLRDAFSRRAGKDGRTPSPAASTRHGTCTAGCTACAQRHAPLDSRHLVLGGALLSTALFGFPVFCLVCPIGLTFATVLLVILLFTTGDVTWSVVVVPALLVAEVVLFRRWCATLCPLSAFMGLLGRLNATFRPTVDESRCLEVARGTSCGRCASVCPVGIDPRHPLQGASMGECTRCRACVEACPAHALKMPFLPKRPASQAGAAPNTLTEPTQGGQR